MNQPQPIVNPLSGEQIVVRRTAAQTGGGVLDWELTLAPGGRVPSAHAHPAQEETFTVIEGRMLFRVGWRRFTATAGQQVRVPPGTVHHFANAGGVPARVAVASRPALGMQDLLETAAALARDQHAAGRVLPRFIDLALFMTDFSREVRAPFLPARLVNPVVTGLARLARNRGLDSRYQRLRTAAAARPAGAVEMRAGAPAAAGGSYRPAR